MRIISGKYKGRRINPPANITARPTTDFAREGLFNLLASRIDFEDITVLDLFAGTGSIGIEFVSRGSRQVTAIEMNDRQLAFIRKACSELKIDNLLLIKSDVFKYITKARLQYDFIFADPPYDLKNLAELPDVIFSNNLLSADGLFVLEHSAKNDFSGHPNFSEHRKYGNVNFSFFKNNTEE